MEDTEEERPESLPQQIRRIAAAGYRYAKTWPAWWGVILWTAVSVGSQIAAHGLLGYLYIGGGSAMLPWYVLTYPTLPLDAISSTIFPLCGLMVAMGRASVAWRITASLAALTAYALSQTSLDLIDYLQVFVGWAGWFLTGLLVHRCTHSVLSSSEPCGETEGLRWATRDLFLLTTLVAVVASGAGWVYKTYPTMIQFSGSGGASFSWPQLLMYAFGCLLEVLSQTPLVFGLFPLSPQPVTVGRFLRYASLSLVLSLTVCLTWIGVIWMQQAVPIPVWSSVGLHWLAIAVVPSFCTVASLTAAGLWFRWWGYRRWPTTPS